MKRPDPHGLSRRKRKPRYKNIAKCQSIPPPFISSFRSDATADPVKSSHFEMLLILQCPSHKKRWSYKAPFSFFDKRQAVLGRGNSHKKQFWEKFICHNRLNIWMKSIVVGHLVRHLDIYWLFFWQIFPHPCSPSIFAFPLRFSLTFLGF